MKSLAIRPFKEVLSLFLLSPLEAFLLRHKYFSHTRLLRDKKYIPSALRFASNLNMNKIIKIIKLSEDSYLRDLIDVDGSQL